MDIACFRGWSILRTTEKEWQVYSQLKNNDSSLFITVDIMQYSFMMIEYLIKTQGVVDKVFFTINLQGLTMTHAAKLTDIFSLIKFAEVSKINLK